MLIIHCLHFTDLLIYIWIWTWFTYIFALKAFLIWNLLDAFEWYFVNQNTLQSLFRQITLLGSTWVQPKKKEHSQEFRHWFWLDQSHDKGNNWTQSRWLLMISTASAPSITRKINFTRWGEKNFELEQGSQTISNCLYL
jgi:hypothetical protein